MPSWPQFCIFHPLCYTGAGDIFGEFNFDVQEGDNNFGSAMEDNFGSAMSEIEIERELSKSGSKSISQVLFIT